MYIWIIRVGEMMAHRPSAGPQVRHFAAWPLPPAGKANCPTNEAAEGLRFLFANWRHVVLHLDRKLAEKQHVVGTNSDSCLPPQLIHLSREKRALVHAWPTKELSNHLWRSSIGLRFILEQQNQLPNQSTTHAWSSKPACKRQNWLCRFNVHCHAFSLIHDKDLANNSNSRTLFPTVECATNVVSTKVPWMHPMDLRDRQSVTCSGKRRTTK